MLTQLQTLKNRLGLTDSSHDAILTAAIIAISSRFDRETNRTLSRTVDFTQEFPAEDTEIIAACYPIEAVTKFELKTSEASAWQEQPDVQYLIRRSCIISLTSPLSSLNQSASRRIWSTPSSNSSPSGTKPWTKSAP